MNTKFAYRPMKYRFVPMVRSLEKMEEKNDIDRKRKNSLFRFGFIRQQVADLESKIGTGGIYADLELDMSVQHPAREFLLGFKLSYTHALEENLDRRFTEAPVLKAFSIFDPTQLPEKTDRIFSTYGQEDVCLLSQHFHFNTDEVTAEWNNFKYHLCDFKIPEDVLKGKGISPTHYVLKKLVREQSSYRIGFKNVVDLAQICLTQPLSNAVVERGASAVKRVKTRLRSSLKNDMFASLLHITLNGPDQESQETSNLLSEATNIWRRTHSRNLPNVQKLPRVGGSDHNTILVVETADTSVQTDPLGTSIDADKEDEDVVSKLVENILFRAFDEEDCGDFCDDFCDDSD